MTNYFKAIFAGLSLVVALVWLSFPFGRTYIDSIGNFLSERDGVWQSVRQIHDKAPHVITSGTIQDTVKIFRKSSGLSHVLAQNRHDALWGMGYAMAAESSFQLFLMADMAAGQIATWFGDNYIQTDQAFLNLGIEEKAWQIHDNLSEEEYTMITTFQDGVNAFLSKKFEFEKPFEFRLMALKRRYFRPVDVIRIYLFWQYLRSYSTQEIATRKAYQTLGRQSFETLFGYLPNYPTSILKSPEFDLIEQYITEQQTQRQKLLPHDHAPLEITSMAFPSVENNERHHVTNISTPFTIPSMFMELRLTTPESDMYGLALPGVPGLLYGSNNQISWSQSSGDSDPVDFYPVTQPLENHKKKTYEIKSKTGTSIQHEVYFGERGVLLRADSLAIQQQWKGYDYDGQIQALWELNNAGSFTQASKSVATRSGLAIDYLISDKNSTAVVQTGCRTSDIAGFGGQESNGIYSGCGELNNQTNARPAAIQSINDNSNETFWKQMRLEDLKRSVTEINTKEAVALTGDVVLAHKLLFDVLKNNITIHENNGLYDFFETTRNWEYEATPQSKITVMLDRFMVSLRENIWDELNGLTYPPDERWVTLLEEKPTHPLFDIAATTEKETAIDILRVSLEEALNYTEMEFGKMQSWSWQNVTQMQTQHISGLPVFNKFSSFQINHSGYNGTIQNLPSRFINKGTTWQLVITMRANRPEIVINGLSSGTSNPFSLHYASRVLQWKAQEHQTILLEERTQPVSFTAELTIEPN